MVRLFAAAGLFAYTAMMLAQAAPVRRQIGNLECNINRGGGFFNSLQLVDAITTLQDPQVQDTLIAAGQDVNNNNNNVDDQNNNNDDQNNNKSALHLKSLKASKNKNDAASNANDNNAVDQFKALQQSDTDVLDSVKNDKVLQAVGEQNAKINQQAEDDLNNDQNNNNDDQNNNNDDQNNNDNNDAQAVQDDLQNALDAAQAASDAIKQSLLDFLNEGVADPALNDQILGNLTLVENALLDLSTNDQNTALLLSNATTLLASTVLNVDDTVVNCV